MARCDSVGRSRRIDSFVVVICLLFLSTAFRVFAQLPTGTILGVTQDSSGAVIPGVIVTVHNLETGQTRTATTGSSGSYRFPALPVGRYDVQAEIAGFHTQTRQGLTLAVSQDAVVDFVMQVGAPEEKVVVTGEASLVNTTTSSLGGLVTEEKIADLPLNGRNYVDLSLMQLGVTQHKNVGATAGMGGVWYSSSGAPPRSNSYLLDGASMVNLWGGTAGSVAGTSLGVEGIREYKVVTNNFSAEYGITMGSQMTIVTKGGTNNFHGSVFEYLRNAALDARNFFDYSANLPGGKRLPPFQRNQFGGSLGGPIKKDKTFFFLVYEGLRENLGVTYVNNVIPANCYAPATKSPLMTNNPCATLSNGNVVAIMQPLFALFPYPNLPSVTAGRPDDRFYFDSTQTTNENYGQIRIDHNFSSSDSLFARYTIDDADQVKPRAYPQYKDLWRSRSQFATLTENHVFNPMLLNTIRFSFSRTNVPTNSISSGGPNDGQLIGPAYSFLPGLQIGSISISGVTGFGPDAGAPSHMKQNIFTWSDDLFYTTGRHSLKFGTLINRYQQGINQEFQFRGTLTFQPPSGSPNAVPQFLAGLARQYSSETPGSDENKYVMYTALGFYAQDDIRVTNRLTFNLGLRYEFITTPEEKFGRVSNLRNVKSDAAVTMGPPFFENPSLRNFSPRFGFAWDVFGNARMSVRGGFAEVYDLGNVGSGLIQAGIGTPPYSSQSAVTSAGFTPSTLLPVRLPFVYTPANIGNTLRLLDYNLDQPHMLQYNLSVERQLPWNTALTVAYAGSRGMNLFQVGDGNPRIPTYVNGIPTWTAASPRINPTWQSIYLIHTGGDSWYNALQIGVTKQVSQGLQFQSSYTYGRISDTTQGQLPADNSGYTPYNSYPFDNRYNKGPAAFDVTHNWRSNAIYRFPNPSNGDGFLNKAANGWWMSGIVSVQTGYPFSPVLNANVSNSGIISSAGSVDRPDLVAGRTPDDIILGTPSRWFDNTAFTIPVAPAGSPAGSGTLGNLARGFLRGPSLSNIDFSLAKDTPLKFLGEGGNIVFRAEFFNILNRANFGMPVVTTNTSNSGLITSTQTPSRQIQFSLKLQF